MPPKAIWNSRTEAANGHRGITQVTGERRQVATTKLDSIVGSQKALTNWTNSMLGLADTQNVSPRSHPWLQMIAFH